MAEVIFDKVDKVYDNDVHAVQDLSLEIGDGEFVVFVGPSGCGKTTALRMVAGLEDISDGELFIGERVVNKLTPKERDIAMRSEEHTSELQSPYDLVCRLLLEKKKKK